MEPLEQALNKWYHSASPEMVIARYKKEPSDYDYAAMDWARGLQDCGELSIVTFRRGGVVHQKAVKV